MRVSLIVATLGRTDELARLVRSLAEQTDSNFELLVLDQNTDDRVLPFVAQAAAAGIDTRHTRLAEPGLSAARNAGLAQAVGAVVGFPDDDCWYEADAIEQIGRAFADQPTWSGVVIDWVEQRGAAAAAAPGRLLMAADWRRFRGGDASSISIFLRRDVALALGGFDPRLGVGQWFSAGEETDLMLSLLKTGAAVACWPAARVHHRFGGATVALPWRTALARARGTGALYVKHALPPTTVVRGLVAPLVKAWWPWRGPRNVGRQLAISLGRSQGALAWWWSTRTRR